MPARPSYVELGKCTSLWRRYISVNIDTCAVSRSDRMCSPRKFLFGSWCTTRAQWLSTLYSASTSPFLRPSDH